MGHIISFIFVGVFMLVAPLGADMYQSKYDYQWKHRLILVKADENLIYDNQKEIAYKNKDGFIERKLKVLTITPNHSLIAGHPDKKVFLVGLDGGVKAMSDKAMGEQELFQTIDAMPMRQSE
ncbi:MAG: hypothetical protein CME62_12400 [Halobacteriovoraceae bacterium]|nr:hypothetical protein [Halobacteriovoraceae bacterium]|tara:strand:- start:2185 stop:2550 length:366 start_codon:yes stop_codon:yes gene_type:complete